MYKLGLGKQVIRKSDGLDIPPASDNADRIEFNAWCAEGNTPDPADIPPELTYAEKRREEYPPIEDQQDAWMKGFEALINGDPIPQETIDMVEFCRAVKDRYPKV